MEAIRVTRAKVEALLTEHFPCPEDWPGWRDYDYPDIPEVEAWRSACGDVWDAAVSALFRLWKEKIEALGYWVEEIEGHEISQHDAAEGGHKWTDEQDDEFIERWVIDMSEFVPIDWPKPPKAAYAAEPA